MNKDSYIPCTEEPQVSAASDWSHFPITRLSLAASLLIIEVGKGVPSLRDRARLSLPPVCNISSAVYHTERCDIGSEYVDTPSWFFLDSLVWRVRNEKMQNSALFSVRLSADNSRTYRCTNFHGRWCWELQLKSVDQPTNQTLVKIVEYRGADKSLALPASWFILLMLRIFRLTLVLLYI